MWCGCMIHSCRRRETYAWPVYYSSICIFIHGRIGFVGRRGGIVVVVVIITSGGLVIGIVVVIIIIFIIVIGLIIVVGLGIIVRVMIVVDFIVLVQEFLAMTICEGESSWHILISPERRDGLNDVIGHW